MRGGVRVWREDIERKTGRHTDCGAATTDDSKKTDSTFRSGCLVFNELQRFNEFDVQKNETKQFLLLPKKKKEKTVLSLQFFPFIK